MLFRKSENHKYFSKIKYQLLPSRSFERSDIDSKEILELDWKGPIPPKLVPPRGPPGVIPSDDADEPNEVFLANEELSKFGVLPIPGGETVPANPPVRPVNGLRLP